MYTPVVSKSASRLAALASNFLQIKMESAAMTSLYNPENMPVAIGSPVRDYVPVCIGTGELSCMFNVQCLAACPGGNGATYCAGGSELTGLVLKESAVTEANLLELKMAADLWKLAPHNPDVARGMPLLGLPVMAGRTMGAVASIASRCAMLPGMDHNSPCAGVRARLYSVMPAFRIDLAFLHATEYAAELTIQWCYDMLVGVSALHAARMIHRDLKADNCMVDFAHRLRTIDLGHCLYMDEVGMVRPNQFCPFSGPESCLDSPASLSPHEFVKGEAYDAYSVGITVAAMLSNCLNARAQALGVSWVVLAIPHMVISQHLMTDEGLPDPIAADQTRAGMQKFAREHTGATLFDWLEDRVDHNTLLTHVTKLELRDLFQGEPSIVQQLLLLRDMAVEMLALDPALRVVPSEMLPRLPTANYEHTVVYAKPDIDAMLREPRSRAHWPGH